MKDLKNIELFLLDMDGTIYIGKNQITGAFAAVQKLREKGKKICFFTNNSSRHHMEYIGKLADMGFDISEDEIYTSGQVTGEFLKKNYAGKKVFLLGNDKLKEELQGYGVEFSDVKPDILVLGFDTSLTYDRLNRFCQLVAEGKPYIATHPDNNCPAEPSPMPDIGAFIEVIRLTVGRTPDHIVGKPYSIAAEGVMRRFGLPAEKIAMVGDRLYTDIKFGVQNGFASVLVLTGETTKKMADESDIKADFVLKSITDMPALA